MKKLRIAIVGPGRLGAVLAEKLHAAGYRVAEIVFRERAESRKAAYRLAKKVEARATASGRALAGTDLVWFCVPDSQIAKAAKELEKRVDWGTRQRFIPAGRCPATPWRACEKEGRQWPQCIP